MTLLSLSMSLRPDLHPELQPDLATDAPTDPPAEPPPPPRPCDRPTARGPLNAPPRHRCQPLPLATGGGRWRPAAVGPWPLWAVAGPADMSLPLETDTVLDGLQAACDARLPLQLHWPDGAGWRRWRGPLRHWWADDLGWCLQGPEGGLGLARARLHAACYLRRVRRDGVHEHVLLRDALGRATLLIGVDASGGAVERCAWRRLWLALLADQALDRSAGRARWRPSATVNRA